MNKKVDRDQEAVLGGISNPPPVHCLMAFEAAARNLSLSKAAGELRVSVSAIGQSIALLEDRLGLHLVSSLSPSVELTHVGQQYLKAVQRFSHGLRDGFYERIPGRRTQLRITAAQAFARLWLAPRLYRFMNQYRGIDLVLTSSERFQTIGSGGVDIGLRYGHMEGDGLVATPLWSDELIAVGASNVAVRARGMSAASIASSMPLIEHPVTSWRQWLASCGMGSHDLHPVLVCSDLHLAIEAACQGLGLVLAPKRVVEQKLQSSELVRASAHSVPAKPYQVVVAREQVNRVAVRQFVGWLLAEGSAQS
ncbi:LysR substrate-binding domain-containing protein [Rhizobacter sp. Root404]|uniref:LysR substrate-binding domain-containing protein n=1 Tax=Rhizobacter sp. Root404 TaxID=1736528 RepID=UPI00138F1352|nr:LysR substrate-binding domain-containing protein [Rhizobacter sp. Root404]